MNEYQFKIGNIWIDVAARSAAQAVAILNEELHLLDEPLHAPGRISRVSLEVSRDVTVNDIAGAYDLELSV